MYISMRTISDHLVELFDSILQTYFPESDSCISDSVSAS